MSTVDARYDFRERRATAVLTAVPWAICNGLQLGFTLVHTAFWIAMWNTMNARPITAQESIFASIANHLIMMFAGWA